MAGRARPYATQQAAGAAGPAGSQTIAAASDILEPMTAGSRVYRQPAMSTAPLPILNIAAYRFAPLTGLAELRSELRALARARRLRGTILLSPEGINLFVAGERPDLEVLLERVRRIPGVEDLEVKESLSREQPFNRMLVKIKAEIIAFGVPGIEPGRYTSRRLPARELKRWLDEGRPVTLLDTRNAFEVDAGTFEGAVALPLDDFRHFPQAVLGLPAELKQQPVVTFCTGGIRCEKAAPYLERAGFTDVYQLEGGILKYFEECGGAHYRGDCFVFDRRVSVQPDLREGELEQCFACQAILTPEDQASPVYVAGKSCPHCYQPDAAVLAALLVERQAVLRSVTSPLPGSVPYENVRPLSVPLRLDGRELLDFLDAMQTHLSRADWERACEEGRLVCRGEVVKPGRILRAGERLLHKSPAATEPVVSAEIAILHEDEALVVVHKPAPLPMHPCGRFHRNTLSWLLEQVYAPLHLRPAHRLDADTSGVVIFSKTREVARRVQPQFETGEVRKTYLARVHGRPMQQKFECHAAISPTPGPNGVRLPDDAGASASTRFRVVREYADGTTLLEVEPLTGRTNQIRVHLWQLGLPIMGDPVYLREGRVGAAQTLSVGEPPLCLHAAAIEFAHPLTGLRVRYEAARPAWEEQV